MSNKIIIKRNVKDIPSTCRKVNLQISTRWQTSRNGAEFRFLASGCCKHQVATKQSTGLFFPNQRFGATVSCALHNSLLRAKNEKRQKRHKFNIYAAFQTVKSPKNKAGLHCKPLRVIFILYILWRGPDHFIDIPYKSIILPYHQPVLLNRHF